MMSSRNAIACMAALAALAAGAESGAQEMQADDGPMLQGDCLIEPRSIIDLGSAEEGIIKGVFVERGDFVAQGDMVAQLDQDLTAVSVELARLRAARTDELHSSIERLAFTQRQMDRMQELHDREVVSSRAHDEAETERDIAELAVGTARMDLREAEIELQRAQSRLDRHTIRSPVTGVVSEILLSPGEYAYEQSPIMRIAEIDPLHVEVFLPVAHYQDVFEGMVADVMPQEPVNGQYQARVTVVDRVFDSASGTFGVRLELPNPDFELPAGLRCEIRFQPRDDLAVAATWSMPDILIDEVQTELDQGVLSINGHDGESRVPPSVPLSDPDNGDEPESAAIPADGDLTMLIQQKLASAGFDVGPLDGILGPRTQAAIASYQVQHDLSPDGYPSDTLYDHLNKLFDGDAADAVDDTPDATGLSEIGHDYLRRAARASDRGDLRLAAFLYLKAIQSADLSLLHEAYAYNTRGRIGAAMGRFAEATRDFDSAIALNPDYVAAYMNRAESHAGSGRYASAIEDLDRTIELAPDFAYAYYRRGVALSELGEIELAIESYNAAIELSPSLVQAYLDRGRAYRALGRRDEALLNFARVFESNPRFPGLRSEMEGIGVLDCGGLTGNGCPAETSHDQGAAPSQAN